MADEERKEEEKTIPFFPDHALNEAKLAWVVIMIVVVGAIILANVMPPTLEPPADPYDTPEHTKPEWYFLFLYQFLKYVPAPIPGPGFGATVPVLALLVLMLWPFLDLSKETRRSQVIRAAIVVVVGIIVLVLTILGATS